MGDDRRGKARPTVKEPTQARHQARQARVAEEMRENLRKRKRQERARRGQDDRTRADT